MIVSQDGEQALTLPEPLAVLLWPFVLVRSRSFSACNTGVASSLSGADGRIRLICKVFSMCLARHNSHAAYFWYL